MKRIKAALQRLKPWLKRHWKAVLIVAVMVGVFLFVVLRKGGAQALATALTPSPTGGAASGDTSGTTTTTTSTGATPVAGPGASAGGSPIDPPARTSPPAGSPSPPPPPAALQTVVPIPHTFSRQPVNNNPVAAALVAAGAGQSEALQIAKAQAVSAAQYGGGLGPGNIIQAGPLKGVTQQGPSPAAAPKIIGSPPAGSVGSLIAGAQSLAAAAAAAAAQAAQNAAAGRMAAQARAAAAAQATAAANAARAQAAAAGRMAAQARAYQAAQAAAAARAAANKVAQANAEKASKSKPGAR